MPKIKNSSFFCGEPEGQLRRPADCREEVGIAARLFVLSFFVAFSPDDWYWHWEFALSHVCVLVLLFRPFHPIAWTGFCIANTWIYLRGLPNICNHGLLQLSVMAIVFLRWRAGTFFRNIKRDVAVIMGICYVAAGFHKLNYDFFNYRISCISRFLSDGGLKGKPIIGGDWISFLSGGINPEIAMSWQVPVFASLLVVGEILAGYLLLTRRAHWSILFAMVIHHAIIGLHEVTGFSTLAFGFLWLQLCGSVSMQTTKIFKNLVIVSGLVHALHLVLITFEMDSTNEIYRVGVLFSYSSVIGVFLLALKDLRTREHSLMKVIWNFCKTPPSPRSMIRIFVSVILIVSFASPYLGLKHGHSAAMYCNLRTEGGISNHVLWPSGPVLFSPMRCIVYADEESINQRATPKTEWAIAQNPTYYTTLYSDTSTEQGIRRLFSRFERKDSLLLEKLKGRPPAFCNGHPAELSEVLQNLPDRNSWWFQNVMSRLLRFKPVSFPQLCEW